MFFPLFVRKCDCSHKMILEKVIYRAVNALGTVTNIDDTPALPHIFLFSDLQRARLFAGRFEFDPAVPGRVRKHNKPIRRARDASPCAFAADSFQFFHASLEISRVDSFRGHIVKNGRNSGRLHMKSLADDYQGALSAAPAAGMAPCGP